MNKTNEQLFDELRALNLPRGQYIVVASGPMGIRGLRQMSDVDILVTDELWKELARNHELFYEHDAVKLRLSENVEALCEASFGVRNLGTPSSVEQINESEIMEGLPFQNLKTTLYFKRLGKRERDIKDVLLIEGWLKENS